MSLDVSISPEKIKQTVNFNLLGLHKRICVIYLPSTTTRAASTQWYQSSRNKHNLLTYYNHAYNELSHHIVGSIYLQEEFEDTKGTIRIRISKKNRQHNGQKKKYKRTNNDLQNIHTKLKIESHEPH